MYKQYFHVVSNDSKNVRVRCVLCGHIVVVEKHFHLKEHTTSNFMKHLSAVHKNAKLVAKEAEKPEKRQRRRNTDDNKPKRQLHIARCIWPLPSCDGMASYM